MFFAKSWWWYAFKRVSVGRESDRKVLLVRSWGGDAQGPARILRVSKVSFNYEIRFTSASIIALGIHHLASMYRLLPHLQQQATTAMT
jgi:hypothetical protein